MIITRNTPVRLGGDSPSDIEMDTRSLLFDRDARVEFTAVATSTTK